MSYFAGTLGATLDRGLILNPDVSHPPPAEGYSDTVINLTGGGPLAYWRHGNTSQLTDDIGTRHGTYSGTVVAVPGLPQNSDGAIDYGGVGTALVAHDSGLSLSVFSMLIWFTINSLPDEPFLYPIFSKGQTGLVLGDFHISLDDSGIAIVRFQSAFAAFTVSSAILSIGSTHCMVVRADSTGFDAYLDSFYLGKNTGFTDAWASNTQPLRFATATWSGVDADVVIDDTAIYGRVITEAEVFQLSQNDGTAPVASNFSLGVPESATTPIDVAAHCTFVGAKSALTVTAVSQPAGGDSVGAANVDNDLPYTAGAVASDTARSFTYQITDANGTSNVATVSVTVHNAAGESEQANCFVASAGNVVVSMAALQTAVNNAAPGDNILIAPGSYSGGTLTFNRDGTEGNPIVVRPQGANGSVVINNASWQWATTSSWLVFSGLHFNGGFWDAFRGDHNRITRCQLRNVTMRMTTARDCRIDHCDWSNTPSSGGADSNGIDFRSNITYVNGTAARNLIDYCYFHGEAGSGDSSFRFRPINSFADPNVLGFTGQTLGDTVTLDHCLFEDCQPGNEFVVIKIGGVSVRFCTFLGCDGYFQFRGGFDSEIRSCWFEATDRDPTAVRIFGDNQLIIGNRFVGPDGLYMVNGHCTPAQFESGSAFFDRYVAATNCDVIGNLFDSGQITFGWFESTCSIDPDGDPNHPNIDEPCRNTLLEANVRNSGNPLTSTDTLCCNPAHVNTTINVSTSASFTPAVKLTSADVGVNAEDPLCPFNGGGTLNVIHGADNVVSGSDNVVADE